MKGCHNHLESGISMSYAQLGVIEQMKREIVTQVAQLIDSTMSRVLIDIKFRRSDCFEPQIVHKPQNVIFPS
jgi:hypothetical protein